MKKLTILIVVMTLFLVACERPAPVDDSAIQPETETTEPPLEFPTALPADGNGGSEGEATAVPATDDTNTDPAIQPEGAGTDDPVSSDELQPTPTTAPAPTEDTSGRTSGGDVSNTERIHTVLQGDTLYAIGLLYGVSGEEIIAANNLSNPDSLEVGQQLIIPAPGTVDLSGGDDTNETPTTGTEEITYIVQPGDTLYRIGLTYGFTVEELADYNSLSDPTRLDIGQTILIPPSE